MRDKRWFTRIFAESGSSSPDIAGNEFLLPPRSPRRALNEGPPLKRLSRNHAGWESQIKPDQWISSSHWGPGWDSNQFSKVALREPYFNYKAWHANVRRRLVGSKKSNNNPAAHHSIPGGSGQISQNVAPVPASPVSLNFSYYFSNAAVGAPDSLLVVDDSLVI